MPLYVIMLELALPLTCLHLGKGLLGLVSMGPKNLFPVVLQTLGYPLYVRKLMIKNDKA